MLLKSSCTNPFNRSDNFLGMTSILIHIILFQMCSQNNHTFSALCSFLLVACPKCIEQINLLTIKSTDYYICTSNFWKTDLNTNDCKFKTCKSQIVQYNIKLCLKQKRVNLSALKLPNKEQDRKQSNQASKTDQTKT